MFLKFCFLENFVLDSNLSQAVSFLTSHPSFSKVKVLLILNYFTNILLILKSFAFTIADFANIESTFQGF